MGTARTRTALLATVLLAALGLGVALLLIAPDATRLPAGGRAVPVLVVVIGWAFAGVGCHAWRRRPDNRTGALLTAFGFTALLSGFVISDDPLPYVASRLADPLAIAVFLHLLLAFPSGRVEGRAARLVVGGAYGRRRSPPSSRRSCSTPTWTTPAARRVPRNPVLIADVDAVGGDRPGRAAGRRPRARRRRRSPSPCGAGARRARPGGAGLSPLLAAGAAVLALGVLSAIMQDAGASADAQQVAQLVFIAAFAALPAAFLLGLVRTHFFRSATVGGLLERLTAAGANGERRRGARVRARRPVGRRRLLAARALGLRGPRRAAVRAPDAATAPSPRSSCTAASASACSSTPPRSATTRRCWPPPPARPRWRSRTTASRSSCGRASRRCASRARGSSRRATASAAASAATSTTAPSSGSSPC